MKPTTLSSIAAAFAATLSASAAAFVPAQLPDPDGKPGDSSKPVKVYILAGQSNMVGMGTIGGATNSTTSTTRSARPC